MATLDLWLDGQWGEESLAWCKRDIPFDIKRMQYDQRYALLIHAHIQQALDNLGNELAEIARAIPEEKEEDWTNCE